MSSSVPMDNKNKDILILGEGPTQGLDDTTLTAHPKYHIHFTQVSYLLMLQKYINSNQKTLKKLYTVFK